MLVRIMGGGHDKEYDESNDGHGDNNNDEWAAFALT